MSQFAYTAVLLFEFDIARLCTGHFLWSAFLLDCNTGLSPLDTDPFDPSEPLDTDLQETVHIIWNLLASVRRWGRGVITTA